MSCLLRSVVQPSDYVPLSDATFMDSFEAIWAAHVEFGTNRSHKKLLGKKRKRVETALDGSEPPGQKLQPPPSTASTVASAHADATAGVAKPPKAAAVAGLAQAGAVRTEQLANRGRWGSTMAARLLSGSGGT